eukprot:13554-Pyramimonas_sp.AAC.1
MIAKCRQNADKTAIGTDGQYSTLMSVLYQTQHGATTRDAHANCARLSILAMLALRRLREINALASRRSEE